MAWITPIYDRTNADVQAVATTIAAWLSNPTSATFTDLKGAFNPSDWNRIEGNMQYLRDMLMANGYIVPSMTFKTDWDYIDYSTLTLTWKTQTVDRILNNLSVLVAEMPPVYITRAVPNDMRHYTQINDIEYIQYQLDQFINNTVDDYRYSGMVIAGDWRTV